jgi:hypothetical protein
MAEHLIIGLQKAPAGNSFFIKLTPAKKFLLWSALIICFLGLTGLITNLVFWSYQKYSFNYFNEQNLSLKNKLTHAMEKQDKLAAELVTLQKEEKYLRLSCGLQSDQTFYKYAKGGDQTAGEMFTNLIDPWQNKPRVSFRSCSPISSINRIYGRTHLSFHLPTAA